MLQTIGDSVSKVAKTVTDVAEKTQASVADGLMVELKRAAHEGRMRFKGALSTLTGYTDQIRQKGEEKLDDVRKKVAHWCAEARKKMDNVEKSMKEGLATAREEVSKFSKNVRDKMQKAVDKAKKLNEKVE